MDPAMQELVDAARRMQGEFPLAKDDYTAASAAAALRTASGAIRTGVCVEVACGIGFCAEHAAIAEMLKHRETRIAAIVAVGNGAIVPPCGRCRELMMQVDHRNLEAKVIVGEDRIVTLRELLPQPWLATKIGT